MFCTVTRSHRQGKRFHIVIISRPSVAGAVLQTALSLIKLFILRNIFKTPSLQYHVTIKPKQLYLFFLQSGGASWWRICYQKYSPLLRLTSISCGGLWPLTKGFCLPSGKKSAFDALFAYFRPFLCLVATSVTFCIDLSNFEKNTKIPKKTKNFNNKKLSKIHLNSKNTKKTFKSNKKNMKI